MQGLSGSVVVVTGGASGIGLGAALRLSKEGASVVLVDRDKKALDDAVSLIPGETLPVVADVAIEHDVESYIDAAVSRFGRIDRYFLNAGIAGGFQSIAETDLADFDHVIAVNLRGVFLGLRASFRQFARQDSGGSIVTTSSVGGLSAGNALAAYVAAKHGVVGLTKAAAVQGAPLGIRVNSIAPALIDTPLNLVAAAQLPDPSLFNSIAVTGGPMNRFGSVDEVGALVAFLLSDEAPFVNGDIVIVDGGAMADSPIRPAVRST